MSAVNITAVNVLDNPSYFQNPLQFEIQYECLHDLQHDLEWKLIYVGSAESEKYDQVLDSVLVGPVVPGQYRFVFQDDIVGVTVLLLTCSYQNQEFIRVGYYVNNEYADAQLRGAPPEKPRIDLLVRSILADKPRVTRFPAEFDAVDAAPTAGTAPAPQATPDAFAASAAPGQPAPGGLDAAPAAPAGYGGFGLAEAAMDQEAMEVEA